MHKLSLSAYFCAHLLWVPTAAFALTLRLVDPYITCGRRGEGGGREGGGRGEGGREEGREGGGRGEGGREEGRGGREGGRGGGEGGRERLVDL